MRISDMLELKVKDVKNRDYFFVKERKTDKKRKIPMVPSVKPEIEKYIVGLKPDDYLFKSMRSKKPISRIQAYRILNEAAGKLGIEEIGTHTMRKTFGYHFYQRQRDLALIQKVFNHSSPSITMRYIGLEEDEIMQGYAAFGGL
nr:tyrosine-type recombinase/integrase [Metabacillus idriensis]